MSTSTSENADHGESAVHAPEPAVPDVMVSSRTNVTALVYASVMNSDTEYTEETARESVWIKSLTVLMVHLKG
jgi:hypothetical protein